MPLPEAPAILVLQGQYPAQSPQPLSGKEALVGLRVQPPEGEENGEGGLQEEQGKASRVQREEMIRTKTVAIPSSLKAGRPATISEPLSDIVAKACTCAETITPSTVYTVMPFPLLQALTQGPT